MNNHPKINYLEMPAKSIEKAKAFFSQAFDWQFTDYGPEYCAFSDHAGIDGGFYASEHCSRTSNGSTLVVFYSTDLEQTQSNIERAGGTINQSIFEFPGGRRFHFLDTNGNEFAVWSE